MIYTLKDFLESQWWSIFANASQQCFCCFSCCFAMVQVMLSLSLIFIEFLGSCSRWRVTNGLVPCVLGPTSFYLKIWVNILNFRMLLCSWEYFKMLLCSWWSSYGFSKIFILVHHVWILDEFMGSSYAFHMILWALSISSDFSTNIIILLDNVFPNLSWKLCRREKSGFVTSNSCFRGFSNTEQYMLPYVSNSNWIWLWACFLLLLFT